MGVQAGMSSLDNLLTEVGPILSSSQFSHPSFREVLAARQFADEINSGRLSVKRAAYTLWLYDLHEDIMAAQENSGYLDDLPHVIEFPPPSLKSEWKPVLVHLAGMLNADKAGEFVEVVGEFHAERIERMQKPKSKFLFDDDVLLEDLKICAKFVARYDTSTSPGRQCKKLLDTLLNTFYEYGNADNTAIGMALISSRSQRAIGALSISKSAYVLKSLTDHITHYINMTNYSEFFDKALFAKGTMAILAHDAILKMTEKGVTLDDLLPGKLTISYKREYRHLHSLMCHGGGIKCLNSLIRGIEECRSYTGPKDVDPCYRFNEIGFFLTIFSIIKRHDLDPKLIKQFNDELSKWKDDNNLMKIYGTALQEFAKDFQKNSGLDLYDQLDKKGVQFLDSEVYKPE